MHNPSNRSRDEAAAYVAAPSGAPPAVALDMESAMANQPLLLHMLGIGGSAGCVPARERSYSVPIGAPVTGRCRSGIGKKAKMKNLSNADYDRNNVPYVERVFGNGVTVDVTRQGKGQYSATLRTGIGGSHRRFVQPMSRGASYAGVGAGRRIQVQATGQHLGGPPVHHAASWGACYDTCQETSNPSLCVEVNCDRYLRTGGSTAGRTSFPVTFPTKRYGARDSRGNVLLYPYSTTRNVTPSKTEIRQIAATGRKISAVALARR